MCFFCHRERIKAGLHGRHCLLVLPQQLPHVLGAHILRPACLRLVACGGRGRPHGVWLSVLKRGYELHGGGSKKIFQQIYEEDSNMIPCLPKKAEGANRRW